MPDNLYLIFNHTLTPAQEADARASLNVAEIVPMPEDIRAIWGNIPPELATIGGYLEPVTDWLNSRASPGDYVLIQGDFGACYLIVEFSFKIGLIPVYSTTRREAVEDSQSDGSVKLTHRFLHQRFRTYGH